MLRKKALRKILVTTFAVFILLVMYLLPNTKSNVLNVETKVEYVDNLETDVVYLLNNDRYLVKCNLLLEGDSA